ncbi:MAG: hypothetical protein IPM83_03690 [Ignavibacteria bacterium]|nr:hypothetical protein [Ignavibacteria bacterium]
MTTCIDASTGKLLAHYGSRDDPEMAVGKFKIRGNKVMKMFSFRDFYDEQRSNCITDLDNV